MRRSLATLPAIALLLAHAAAQDSVQRDVQLPSGTTVTRTCASWKAEGVTVMGTDPRTKYLAAQMYYPSLAKAIERRLDYYSKDSAVLVASFAARIVRGGWVSGVTLVKPSEHTGFNLAAQRAAGITANDPDVVPTPSGMPDSAPILIVFGEKGDGSLYQVTHVRCAPMPYPDNPAPDYPMAETIIRSEYHVLARYLVDTTGKVDSASIQIEESASEAFAQATIAYLSKIRYLPEEFDGVKERLPMERTIVFASPIPANRVDSTY